MGNQHINRLWKQLLVAALGSSTLHLIIVKTPDVFTLGVVGNRHIDNMYTHNLTINLSDALIINKNHL